MRRNKNRGKEKSVFPLTDRKLNFAIYRVETFSYPHLRNKLELNWILSSDTLNQSTVFTQSSLFSGYITKGEFLKSN